MRFFLKKMCVLDFLRNQTRPYTTGGIIGGGPAAASGSRYSQSCLVQIFTHKFRKRKKKTSHRMFGHIHEVLNEVYLQKILHGWAVNRETNLMSLLNP